MLFITDSWVRFYIVIVEDPFKKEDIKIQAESAKTHKKLHD